MTTPAKLVFKNIVRRRGRFVFTLQGIVIAMASFVAFMALGASVTAQIRKESSALGANLAVTSKGSRAFEQASILTGEQLPTTIAREEAALLQGIDGMKAIPFLVERSAIENRPVSVLGIMTGETPDFKG